jgi:hypothetical protein
MSDETGRVGAIRDFEDAFDLATISRSKLAR